MRILLLILSLAIYTNVEATGLTHFACDDYEESVEVTQSGNIQTSLVGIGGYEVARWDSQFGTMRIHGIFFEGEDVEFSFLLRSDDLADLIAVGEDKVIVDPLLIGGFVDVKGERFIVFRNDDERAELPEANEMHVVGANIFFENEFGIMNLSYELAGVLSNGEDVNLQWDGRLGASVPEPSGLLLMFGAAALGVWRKK